MVEKTYGLFGCGSRRERLLRPPDAEVEDWSDGQLITLDHYEGHEPDKVHDLRVTPYPFEDETFDEVHLYDVLEHLWEQGNAGAMFTIFGELWRILKPEGLVCAVVPWWESMWAWGDPDHKNVISPGTLVFLDQDEYEKQIGVTPMSDFRYMWRKSFKRMHVERQADRFIFILQKA
jgi:SAM-dependent methyltransferase